MERQQNTARVYRLIIGIFIFVLVLGLYVHTDNPAGDIKVLVTAWTVLILLTGWWLMAWLWNFEQRAPRIFGEVALCFLAVYSIATALSAFPMMGLVELSKFVVLFGLYYIASQVYRTEAQVHRLMVLMCLAVGLASCYGVLQKTGLDPFPWADKTSDVYTNIPSTFGNPNFAAHCLILVIIMALYCIRRNWFPGKGNFRVLWGNLVNARYWLLLLGLFFIHLNWTHQRAGWVGLAAALLLVVVAWGVHKLIRRAVPAVAVTLILTALLAMAGVAGAMYYTQHRTGTPFPLDISLLLRYQSYVSASDMILDSPVIGHGPGVYGLAYYQYWTPFEQEWFAQELRMNAHVHNDLMELALDAGLLASGLYLVLHILGISYGLLMAFAQGTALRRRLGYVFAALFMAFLVDGLFGFNLRVPISSGFLFLMMGALDGLWSTNQPVEARKRLVWLPAALKCGTVVIVAGAVTMLSLDFYGDYCYQRGRVAQARRDQAQAKQYFEQGEQLVFWNGNFARRLAELALNKNDLAAAKDHYERALAKNPHNLLAHLFLGHVKLQMARNLYKQDPQAVLTALTLLKEAAAEVEQLVQASPMLPEAQELLGRIGVLSAQYADASPQRDESTVQAYWGFAEHHFMQAIQYGAENQSGLYRALMETRLSKQDIAGAEKALLRAVQSDPKDMKTWPLFLDFAENYQRYDRLRDSLNTQIRLLNKEDEENRTVRTRYYLWLARVEEQGFNNAPAAEKAYLAALQHNALLPEVWASFARYAYDHQRTGMFHDALLTTHDRLLQEGQQPLPEVIAVARILREGVKALDEASTYLYGHFRSYRQRPGGLNAQQVYGWAARTMLELALTIAPGEACRANMNLGIMLSAMNELIPADRMFSRAFNCLPDEEHPTLAIFWADAMLRMNRGDEAVALLKEVTGRFPEDVECRCALARTLKRLGRIEEARTEYETLLEVADLTAKGRQVLEEEMKALEKE